MMSRSINQNKSISSYNRIRGEWCMSHNVSLSPDQWCKSQYRKRRMASTHLGIERESNGVHKFRKQDPPSHKINPRYPNREESTVRRKISKHWKNDADEEKKPMGTSSLP